MDRAVLRAADRVALQADLVIGTTDRTISKTAAPHRAWDGTRTTATTDLTSTRDHLAAHLRHRPPVATTAHKAVAAVPAVIGEACPAGEVVVRVPPRSLPHLEAFPRQCPSGHHKDNNGVITLEAEAATT